MSSYHPHRPTGEHPDFSRDSRPDGPPEGERWSTWDVVAHGPTPRPHWVVTELGAVDADHGILKSGKEADVHVIRRWVPGPPGPTGIPGRPVEPGTRREAVMAAKRYRSHEHRLFHRDAGYLEGRRVRRSRETRAMARRTALGKQLISGQWAHVEFETLCALWELGLPVPYPVSFGEGELLMEFIGDSASGVAAPRLAQAKPDRELLPALFDQVREIMLALADRGWTHGDLSPYNVLLDRDRLVVIDWPQVVDIVGNPHGMEFLDRDARTMCQWFTRAGFPADANDFFGELVAAATSRW